MDISPVRVIILAAGQGKRLLPLTADRPKALIDIGGKSLVARQVEVFARAGFKQFSVVTGYAADLMDKALRQLAVELSVDIETIFNPFYAITDNLASCWMARAAMRGDFIQVNGDNVFNDDLVAKLLAEPLADINVAINRKSAYDGDDMKVMLGADGRVTDIGKALDATKVQAEAIGFYIFTGQGPAAYVDLLERDMRQPEALKQWFPLAVARLARERPVDVVDVSGVRWGEVDFPDDVLFVRDLVKDWA